MSKVTIYQFTVYDIGSDTIQKSRRWGTREAIEGMARGRVLEATAVGADSESVGAEIPGLTARDFDPHRRVGFQKQVTG